MKPNTIAETMAALRSQLDAIEYSEVSTTTSTSVLKEHMDLVEQEYLIEAPNFLSGLGKGLALNKNAVPKGAASKIGDPNYSYKGQPVPQGKHYADPSPEDIKSFERGRKTGIGGATIAGGAAIAGLTHSYDKYNDENPDPLQPKANKKIQAFQEWLNKSYKLNLELTGIYDKPTKEAYETYVLNPSVTTPPKIEPVEPKVEPVVKPKVEPIVKPKVDQQQSNDLNIEKLPPEITNQTPPVKQPVVTQPNANTQQGSGAQPTPNNQPEADFGNKELPPETTQQIMQLLQQMKDLEARRQVIGY